MQRPVMEPSLCDDAGHPHNPGPGRWMRRLRWVIHLIGRVLFIDLFHPFAGELRIEDGSRLGRFARGLAYRLVFVPVLFTLVAAVMVWAGTHPPAVGGDADPASVGLYFEPISMLSEDGVRLDAWLVPVVDARRVLREKEDLLIKKQPAIVLVHDYAQSRQQLLPLVRPLHEDGLVVLVLATRGAGTYSSMAAQTFGLNESLDVWQAVEMLRRRPYVDPQKIAILGIGAGANAAILTAQRDPSIAALVLHEPIATADEAVRHYIAPSQSWLTWMRPMCKWAFEVGYQLDIDDMDVSRHGRTLTSRPVLMLENHGEAAAAAALGANRIRLIEDFLDRRLIPHPTGMAQTTP